MKESRRAFLASLGVLAACGGGGSGPSPAPAPTPTPPPPPPPPQRLLRLLPPYAGSLAVIWGVSEDGKLWKSANGGDTWAAVSSPTIGRIDNVFSAGTDTLWLAGRDGDQPALWRGTGNGTGWVKRTVPAGAPATFALSSDDGNTLTVTWATSFGGMTTFYSRFQSLDGGMNWASAPEAFGECLSVGARWCSAKALRGTNFGLLPYGAILRSQNSGLTWDTRLALDDSRAGMLLGSPNPSSLLVTSFSHKGSYAPPVAPVDWRLHLTQDGGTTWTEWDAPASVQGFTAISGVPSLGWLIASRVEDTQLLRSLDYGRTWQPLVLPAGYTEFLQLEQGALWARNVTAVQVSTDMGSTWAAATWPAGADVTTTRVMQTSPTRLLAQAANGAGVWTSADLGKTWQDVKVS